MGWQAGNDSRPGEVPGQVESLPELPAGFEHGGALDSMVPSAVLAAALEAAAGPDGLYEGTGTDALVGIARQWAAIESWAAAGLLGSLRAMMREDRDGRPLPRRRSDLPEGWDDSLNYEVSAALAMGPVSAGNLAGLAHALGTRLPGIGRLLAGGTLTKAKAKLIVATFDPLNDDEAVRAEALIVAELAGKTYFQVERLAWRAALAVAPDVAERRRSRAERERARVTVFREESGAVGLSGRDLPAAQALSGHASVVARAREYQASGAFPGQATSGLEALAYLHLLNGVSARDAIAFARTAAEPPDAGADEDSGRAGGPGGGNGADGHGPGDDGRDSDGGGGDGDGDGGRSGGDGGPGADGDGDGDGGPGASGGGPGAGGDFAVLPEVTVPLVTLQGRAERAGDSRPLGPLDPALSRDLAAAAARSPRSRWELTVVDGRGYAVGYGIARPRRAKRHDSRWWPWPPGTGLGAGLVSGPDPGLDSGPDPGLVSGSCSLPARVSITVTAALLHQLASRSSGPRPGAPAGDWELTPRTAGDADGTWTLTLPGGRELAVRFDVVPTYGCDHRHQADAYQPGQRLRRLVQVRDRECTFPPCSRPAKESDFEHAVPYDQGGQTCACNAGARSRRCHRVKQSPGWTVTQPKPGWHTWTTPTGRTYTQEPWRYIA